MSEPLILRATIMGHEMLLRVDLSRTDRDNNELVQWWLESAIGEARKLVSGGDYLHPPTNTPVRGL